jgi:anti-anti-sigma factor
MKIETQNYNQVTVLKLLGEFASDSAKAFQDHATSVIAAGSRCIVLDLSEVGFIDSACLEQLLWFRDYCQENRCQMKLAALDETCTKILEITRLLPQFDTYAELPQAVKSFV